MSFLKNIFGGKLNEVKEPLPRVKLSKENIIYFPKIESLLNNNKIKYDSVGRLRYLHGAPVGDMILIRINKDGTPIYKESAHEWFDPESPKAKEFVWP